MMYKRKDCNNMITAWSFNKRHSRAQVMQYLRELRLIRDGKPFPARHMWPGRPIDVERVRSYCSKNQIQVESGLGDYAPLHEIANSPWFTIPEGLVLDDNKIRPAERFLYHCQSLTRGSFESGEWHSTSPELIITSSPGQIQEVQSLHHFLGQVEVASKHALQGNLSIALKHWESSFKEVKTIVGGRYHDNIPNLIQTLSNVWTTGHHDAAKRLKTVISDCGKYFSEQEPGTAAPRVFALFADLDFETIVDLEEQLMKIFTAMFGLYLGDRNYNAFVMRIDSARRKLKGQDHALIAEWVPDVGPLDEEFGPANRRPLEALRLHTEILYARGKYVECEATAVLLIRRALMIPEEEDPWQRLHFLIKGQYYLGTCQYRNGNLPGAAYHLTEALKTDRKFLIVEPADIFFAERKHMEEMIDAIQHL